MAAQAMRAPAPDPRESVVHELSPIRFEGESVNVRLSVRWAPDGVWRGRLVFAQESGTGGIVEMETAEIFCGASAQDLWESVRDLREHHLRDLYRSLV